MLEFQQVRDYTNTSGNDGLFEGLVQAGLSEVVSCFCSVSNWHSLTSWARTALGESVANERRELGGEW